MKRRTFLQSSGLALGAAPGLAPAGRPPVDFRYAPQTWQSTFCFPDDPHKSLVGEQGDLRYGHTRGKPAEHFPVSVSFTLNGLDPDRVAWQRLEAPGVPIIRTRIDRSDAFLELTTFATRRAGEGRVDNVILEVRPKSKRSVLASPVVVLRTRRTIALNGTVVRFESDAAPVFLAADCPLSSVDTGDGYRLAVPARPAASDQPLRCFFRFPLDGQVLAQIQAGLAEPDALLAEARSFWQGWSPFQGQVNWRLAGIYHEFLVACARNILQARELRDGKLTFQVGPTVYRGLWVVDGHFILEAARYLGFDAEVQQGLETTWGFQQPDGQVFASAGKEHWKDTGIVMFSMVRQAELAGDWTYFRKMQPQVLKATEFLASLRGKAKAEGSALGRYGMLAKGFGDGGIGGGLREEFTNTIWVLAGLRATADAAERLQLGGYDPVKRLYQELRQAFFAAAPQHMRRHAGGFDYLPMLLKEDPFWDHADELRRPRPQTGQWALAHAIYPGLVFDRNDPVVNGYLKLMQASTQEDVPIETGWLPHDGLWNYDAAFAAHAFLWAGVQDWSRSIFTGFLNHATPLYCWREEQPLRGALIGKPVGDMPHNWASAECILFLRHMLALEDGRTLRLLAGLGGPELEPGEPYRLDETPTRFGRVNLLAEPLDGRRGWRLKFTRGAGPAPAAVHVPEGLGPWMFSSASGAGFTRQPGIVRIDPQSGAWEAIWRKV